MFWRRKGEFDDLEARLRAGGPEPGEGLVRSIRATVEVRPRTTRRVLRVGLAAALTLALAVTLAALGAASHTATAASDIARFVQTGSFSGSSNGDTTTTTGTGTSTPASGTVTSSSVGAADDQYEEKVTICHRTSASDPGNTLKLSPSGAASHLQGHRFDYSGPCR